MDDILTRLSYCVEVGKINKASPYPPHMKDQEGADELAKRALEEGIKPDAILEKSLIPAMAIVGNKFGADFYSPDIQGAVNYLKKNNT
jgi:5-methyltetrahydrofolate--homocysteine methyltransferase